MMKVRSHSAWKRDGLSHMIALLLCVCAIPVAAQQMDISGADFDKNGYIDDGELLIILNYWAEHRPIPMLTPPGPIITLQLPDEVKLELLHMPAGSFLMGSPDNEVDRWDNEGPVHRVTISKGLYLGRYEVTQAQWEAVMESNPSR